MCERNRWTVPSVIQNLSSIMYPYSWLWVFVFCIFKVFVFCIFKVFVFCICNISTMYTQSWWWVCEGTTGLRNVKGDTLSGQRVRWGVQNTKYKIQNTLYKIQKNTNTKYKYKYQNLIQNLNAKYKFEYKCKMQNTKCKYILSGQCVRCAKWRNRDSLI